jgi:hypothetical protein
MEHFSVMLENNFFDETEKTLWIEMDENHVEIEFKTNMILTNLV